ncbi:MAG: CHAT domain-containing protein [Erythrobacter sp.]|nr:CHAT domain-containing protein [Erythrobacter sp.]
MLKSFASRVLATAMALSLAGTVGSAISFAQAPAGRITEEQIAQVVAQFHPVPPDIRNPTAYELSLINTNARQAQTPLGNFYRINAYKRLIEELEKSFGPTHPLLGGIRLRLADELASGQELEQAQAQLSRARKIIEERLAPDDLFYLALHESEQLLHYLRGDIRAQLTDVAAMKVRAARDFAGNSEAELRVLRAEELVQYRLGQYNKAAATGARRLAMLDRLNPEPNARTSAVMAGQVRNLIAAGRLIEAKALLEARGDERHLDELRDRYTIASLARARGRIFEEELRYEEAQREYETAYRIFSADDFKDDLALPVTIPVDSGLVGTVRTALEIKRLEVRKTNSRGFLEKGWDHDKAIKLQLGRDISLGDGPLLNTSLLKRNNAFRIEGPLQAMAARYNGFAYALGNDDHALAERFWRELVEYQIRSTGEGSVKVGEALVDLAGGLLAARRPFAARDEALKAVAVLEGQIAEEHPTMVRARAVAALSLSRQGRGDLATTEIEAALKLGWANPQQNQRELLALLVERDLELQRKRDRLSRAAFWDKWDSRMAAISPGTSLIEIERLAMVMLGSGQAKVDQGECVPDETVEMLFATRETLRKADAMSFSQYSEGPLTRTLLLTDQVIAEALSCKPQRGYTLASFLAEMRGNQRYGFVRMGSPELSARNDRFARLLAGLDEFGTDILVTDLALEYAADAAYTASFEITNARAMGEVATTDDRLERVLASEGAGFEVSYGLETQLDILWRAHEADYARGPLAGSDFEGSMYSSGQFDAAFKAAQLLRIDGNSQTLALASARAAAPNPRLRETVAEYQTLTTQLFRELAVSTEPTAELQDLQARHAALDNAIREEFPAYYEFAAPRPLSLYDVRNSLKQNEGLLTMLPVGDYIYVFAISEANGWDWHRFNNSAAEIADMVSALRCDLDPVECGASAAVQTRGQGSGVDGELWTGASFNRNLAYELYELLISPVAPVLSGRFDFNRVDRLYVVTSGAISALPLALLLTEAPSDDGYEATAETYLAAPWFSDKYEISYLPSVSDLKGTARKLRETEGFIGFGDPVLGPPVKDGSKGHRGGRVFSATRSAGGSPLAKPDELMKLASLLGAEEELAAVASLFPQSSRLLTKAAATEPAVKRDLSLAGSQVILFSTHGVLPDPGLGNAEPGLVMTPPSEASEFDDGLLSASEAAALDFTSELLILSACNTATEGSFSGADSLSGLARAFIFAGARSVYASHWQVSDAITKELIFASVDIALREPQLTRSQALAKAMRAIRTGAYEDGRTIEGWDPSWAHPSAWAPFVAITSVQRGEQE